MSCLINYLMVSPSAPGRCCDEGGVFVVAGILSKPAVSTNNDNMICFIVFRISENISMKQPTLALISCGWDLGSLYIIMAIVQLRSYSVVGSGLVEASRDVSFTPQQLGLSF